MRTAAHIIETVGKLVKKYDTRDPYELCKCLEIKIHFYNLEKKLKGFFFYQSRQKNIVIDSNVNDVLERILIAHELGHAVLHTKIAMMKGFQEMEVLDGRSQDEDEANFFAAELLLEDKEVLECLPLQADVCAFSLHCLTPPSSKLGKHPPLFLLDHAEKYCVLRH